MTVVLLTVGGAGFGFNQPLSKTKPFLLAGALKQAEKMAPKAQAFAKRMAQVQEEFQQSSLARINFEHSGVEEEIKERTCSIAKGGLEGLRLLDSLIKGKKGKKGKRVHRRA